MTAAGLALTAVVSFALSLAMRIGIIWSHRHRGCDAYYFLLCAEQYRRDRKLPIVLPPVYTLERQEQWYPPGFSVLLGLLPRKAVERYYWAISPVIDSLLATLVAAMAHVASGRIEVGLLAGAAYAINGAVIPDTTSLNSRPLGALLFTGAVLALIYGLTSATSWATCWLPAAVFLGLGYLLLLSHKLSAQMLYFLLPFVAIATGSWRYAAALAALLTAALLLSRRTLTNVWRGQYDILSFWAKNWRLLGAHPIYGSPIYERPEEDTRRVHMSGWRGLLKGASYMGMNTFALPALFVALEYRSLSPFDQGIAWWAVGVYTWAAMTQLVPQMRFLGEGYRYLKLAAVPVCYLAVLPLAQRWTMGGWYYVALALSAIAAVAVLLKLFSFMRDREGTTIPFLDNPGLVKIIGHLKAATDVGRVLCLPDSLGDAVGYFTRKPVLRGTHNVPFSAVAPFFPVYRLPVEYLVRGYGVTHIVLSRDYASPGLLELGEFADRVLAEDEYALHVVREPRVALAVTQAGTTRYGGN